MLKLHNLSVVYPIGKSEIPLSVLVDIELSFYTGAIATIIGPSGCGKSTLLNVIAGLLMPTKGTIEYPKSANRSKRGVGYVFQSPSLVPWLSIRQNALFGAQITGEISHSIARRCDELLQLYGLEDFENAYPAALSGGMQQRVSLIRAVLSGAKIILFDEPFSNSDFLMRRTLQKELSRLVDEEQLIAILVTHDIEEAVRIGDRVIVLTPRPAQVALEIEIPTPRQQRLQATPGAVLGMAPYIEQIEQVFASTSSQREFRPRERKV